MRRANYMHACSLYYITYPFPSHGLLCNVAWACSHDKISAHTLAHHKWIFLWSAFHVCPFGDEVNCSWYWTCCGNQSLSMKMSSPEKCCRKSRVSPGPACWQLTVSPYYPDPWSYHVRNIRHVRPHTLMSHAFKLKLQTCCMLYGQDGEIYVTRAWNYWPKQWNCAKGKILRWCFGHCTSETYPQVFLNGGRGYKMKGREYGCFDLFKHKWNIHKGVEKFFEWGVNIIKSNSMKGLYLFGQHFGS